MDKKKTEIERDLGRLVEVPMEEWHLMPHYERELGGYYNEPVQSGSAINQIKRILKKEDKLIKDLQ